MSQSALVTYPLDLSGVSETNKVLNETRDIATNQQRIFVALGGPFYTESFEIYNDETGEPLRPVDDFLLLQPHLQAALRTGKDVQSAIMLKVEAPIRVRYSYQVVGGEYSWNIGALQELIDQINLDDRPVKWGSILGRPTGYPPAPHIHDIGDTYGWEYVVWQLERITYAIMVGDEASHDELRQQMQMIRDELNARIDGFLDALQDHIEDTDNPHQVTKSQVGLSQVDNFLTATQAEALAGIAADRFLTPAGAKVLAAKLADDAVNEHEARQDNPHQVTKAQVGLSNVDNYATATQAEAEAGTNSQRFMTPQRTKQAIAALVGNAFAAHVANVNNPHQVTKAQVGLGNVDNYATATTAEAQAGTVNNKFMTPLRTKEAITALVGNDLSAHISNLNNPHQTTAAQVGAYTTAQTNSLLAQKLGINDTAVNSGKLGGSTLAQVLQSAYDAIGSMGKRNVFISTADPGAAQGVVGDVWLKY